MADIDVQRKDGMGWLWWVLGLILLALIIWWIAAAGGEDEVAEVPIAAEAPVTEVQPTVPPVSTPEPIAQGAGIPVSQIIESPATWTGQTVGGEVRVVEVPTDRGFWIEDQGERLFVVLRDAPAEQPVDINPGQTLRLREAVIYENIANVPGQVDPDTRNIAQGLPVFLGVDERNVEILAPAGGA